MLSELSRIWNQTTVNSQLRTCGRASKWIMEAPRDRASRSAANRQVGTLLQAHAQGKSERQGDDDRGKENDAVQPKPLMDAGDHDVV